MSKTRFRIYFKKIKDLFLKFIKFKHVKAILAGSGIFIILCFGLLYVLNIKLLKEYKSLQSVLIKDRNGKIIATLPNAKQQYSFYVNSLPPHIKDLLLKKEDRFFYFHPGINPISLVRAAVAYILKGTPGGSSTITQQLAKNLLSNEQNRSIKNKIIELAYTASLELFLSKEQILTMYANTVYMGNQLEGINEGSNAYFGKNVDDLNDTQAVMLLATISSPSTDNPWRAKNKSTAVALAERLGITFIENDAKTSTAKYSHTSDTNFELSTLGKTCATTCITTLDLDLTANLREILGRTISETYESGARNGAIVVIKVPENELLAIVGTPDTSSTENGHGINMAIEPRPIGSTAKPFIYLNAFEKGLRPYTLVDDREYKFPVGTGFPIYPKNYDGLYHGIVTLHEALSNSLNVPTVKTLEYVGLSDFYYFLQQQLAFSPLQDLDRYQYGIALGGLEMDPLTLAYYLTLFPENGNLKPLHLYSDTASKDSIIRPPMSRLLTERQIADKKYVELVTKILNDRKTGVQQFGLTSSLNLSQNNYAVKTGTSRDYHDSWTVGYTPDFVVAVWLGNAENTPLKHVTGQSGAGRIWNQTMELLFNSPYNKKTPLDLDQVKDFNIGNSIDYGLADDVISEHRNILEDKTLILSPHADDTILLESKTIIPLRAPKKVEWYEGTRFLGSGENIDFAPTRSGTYTIKAIADNGDREAITIHIVNTQ